jgi:hypothetical protein
MPRVRQQTDVHCGPAVLEMLSACVGLRTDQHWLTESSGVDKKLFKKIGMNVDQMGHAVKILLPTMLFWSKEHATIDDLDALIHRYHVPAGIEWQGEFGQYSDDDNGHYSVVTDISIPDDRIVIADPFIMFAGRDRTFKLSHVVTRWWDENAYIGEDGRRHWKKDHHMVFTIAPPVRRYPHVLGMRPHR